MGQKSARTALGLDQLERLFLADNGISEVTGLSRLEQLSLIDLSRNQVSVIDGLADGIPEDATVLLMGNPLSCAQIDTLLAVGGPNFVYDPLPDGCG